MELCFRIGQLRPLPICCQLFTDLAQVAADIPEVGDPRASRVFPHVEREVKAASGRLTAALLQFAPNFARGFFQIPFSQGRRGATHEPHLFLLPLFQRSTIHNVQQGKCR